MVVESNDYDRHLQSTEVENPFTIHQAFLG